VKPGPDILSVACKVNLSAKKKGINMEQDLDLNNLLDSLSMVLTRKLKWRVALMKHDP
jgi:hypothetical protein